MSREDEVMGTQRGNMEMGVSRACTPPATLTT